MVTYRALSTRWTARLLAGAALVAAVCSPAVAQPWPSKAVTFKSAMAAGSTTDATAREIGKMLSDRMGQPVVVDPLPGSGGLVAAQKVINSPADGYTLLFVSNGLISNQAMRARPQTDLSKDLIAISPLIEGYFGLYVNAELPVR
ncbi:MAG: tripartite tricarboxylate transporter substrate binding protein, partial [Burkholderiales bacterium]